MIVKAGSLIALAVAFIGVLYLFNKDYIFSKNILAIAIQICAAGLMIWARVTFGIRSFHATANTTKGGLVTNGPYHFLRHPVYASLIYFFGACAISYPFKETIAAILLIIAGLSVRILLEEKSLQETYNQEYKDYSKRTKRIIPFLF